MKFIYMTPVDLVLLADTDLFQTERTAVRQKAAWHIPEIYSFEALL
jgi:hypothetical protein